MDKGGMCEQRDRGGEGRRTHTGLSGFTETSHQLF